jgi:osmotically-inducible protein OsmY
MKNSRPLESLAEPAAADIRPSNESASQLATPADTDLAARVTVALRRHLWVPNAVTAQAEAGWITLSGSVGREYQRNAAHKAAGAVPGVRGVTDAMVLLHDPIAEDVKTALHEDREVEDALVKVEVRSDGTVTLTGVATSRSEREAAGWAAWRAPGVTHVLNHLVVKGQSMPHTSPH